jgi:peptidoglycan/xylan/chitin deacetylase (PgdA/CDA1 family)
MLVEANSALKVAEQVAIEFAAGVGVAALAAGGYAYAAMWPGSRVFGPAMRAPRNAEELALTFDDGPNPRWTPQLLDLLARHEVRATFFLIGQYAAAQPELVRRMQAEGHLIGNHTWTHPNLAVTGVEKTREELSRTSGELESITGAAVAYFRPPFGARRPATLRIARELGMTPVLWNAITPDWTAASSEQVTPKMAKIIDGHRRRGYATNLVLHDGGHLSPEAERGASVAAAGELIERYRISCRFVKLDAWRI